jgi:hypothetical protein
MGLNPIPTFRKEVVMPIEVPVTDFCWDHITPCTWFDNEGGHPTCDLFVDHLKYNEEGLVRKPDKCLKFKDAK